MANANYFLVEAYCAELGEVYDIEYKACKAVATIVKEYTDPLLGRIAEFKLDKAIE